MAAGFRASAVAGSGQSSTVTSLTITVPSTAVAGDYATILVNSSSMTATLTTPAGWAVNASAVHGASSSVWRYSKTIVSGDIGATVTLTFSAAQRCEAVMLIASGVDPSGATGNNYTETSPTSNPTLPTVTGVTSGSLVFGVLLRRFSTTPAGTLHLPATYNELTPATSTGYGNSPELSIVGGWAFATGSTISGSGTSSPSSTGVNYIVTIPASIVAGSSATVALATATVTATANPLTVTGAGPGVAPADTQWPPSPYRSAWRAGGFFTYYSVSASVGGIPVQGAQDLRPTGGSITDTTKPGVRRVLNLDLAPQHNDGETQYQTFDLLSEPGTTLTVTCVVTYPNRSSVQIPMGVFDVDSEKLTEGGGGVSLTAPDKWARIQRARFLLPQASTPGTSVTQQIVSLIQGALGSSEEVQVTATSTATVGALTWDRDRDKAITDLAQSIGAWVYAGRDGTFIVADVPQIGASADWLVDSSPTGVLLSLDREKSRQGVYNVVVVSSSASGGEAFPTVYAWDGDPASPTYAGRDPLNSPGSAGPFGIVPMFYASPVLSSATEAQDAGRSILSRTIGMAVQSSLSCVPNPAMDAFAVLDILPPPIPFSPSRSLERIVADTITHPLGLSDSSPMQITGRSTRTDFTEDVSG